MAGVDRGKGLVEARAIEDGAADGMIEVLAGDGPSFAIGALAEQAELVFDRRARLHRGGIAGVEVAGGHAQMISPSGRFVHGAGCCRFVLMFFRGNRARR